MQRRSFMKIGAVAAFALVPYPLTAAPTSFKAKFWDASTVPHAIKALYGDKKPIKSDAVKIIAYDFAANNRKIPMNIVSDLSAKSVALFQDANPQSAIALWTLNKHSIIDFQARVKVQSKGVPVNFTAVVEADDGQLYYATHSIDVAKGGCIDSYSKL